MPVRQAPHEEKVAWKIVMDAFERARRHVQPQRLLDVKYEDLCDHPEKSLRHVLEFCELPWGRRFAKPLAGYSLRSRDDRWRTELTSKQQLVLESVLRTHLDRLGYE